MAESGVFGFRKNGTDIVIFFDGAEPDTFLEEFIDFLLTWRNRINEIFSSITVLDWKDNANVGTRFEEFKDINRWAKALRDKENIVILNDILHIKNSLFCHFGYIYNFDEEVLEYWLGEQIEPDAGNRFGRKKVLTVYNSSCPTSYYPCKCVRKYSLKYLDAYRNESIREMKSFSEENKAKIRKLFAR